MKAMVKSIAKSFSFATRGLLICAKNERNFRIHIVATVYVAIFSFLYKLDKLNFMILLLLFGLVLFAEAINSSIETVVNMQAKAYNKYARDAKDIAAGSVLILAIIAVLIAILSFSDIEKLKAMLYLLMNNMYITIPIIISIILSILFVKGKKR